MLLIRLINSNTKDVTVTLRHILSVIITNQLPIMLGM